MRKEGRMRNGEQKGGMEVYVCIYNMATHFSILAGRILKDRDTWQAKVHGLARAGHDLVTKPPPSLPKDGLT